MNLSKLATKSLVYKTKAGVQLCGDSLELLGELERESVDLIMTSPPFALQRKKSYGNKEQSEYVDWLCSFGEAARGVLKDRGSFVLDLGGAYRKGCPARSLYNFRVLLRFCDDLGYTLAEDFYWFNPSKLPSPIEWVNKQKIRAKDSVNTIWWFSRSERPKADVRKVLTPYSARMKKLLEDPEKFYTPKKRPSGHDIAASFGNGNSGAIPSNLLRIPNTDSNSHYMRTVKRLGGKRHPARFPAELPAFFIRMLTDPGDVVVDIFSGSNTTGATAESLGRRWISMEIDPHFATLSVVRFMEGMDEDRIANMVASLESGRVLTVSPVHFAPVDRYQTKATEEKVEAGRTRSKKGYRKDTRSLRLFE